MNYHYADWIFKKYHLEKVESKELSYLFKALKMQ